MATRRKSPEEMAKSRLLFRARKLARDVQRYQTFGFVTDADAYEEDDRKLLKAIDGLYDSARKAGLGEDTELQEVRLELRRSWSDARRAALEIRASKHQAKADQLRAAARRTETDPAFDAYRRELGLSLRPAPSQSQTRRKG